ncbi:MAG: PAS domain-containing protein [Acidobacteria bacterium]|nr:PAS domain-containing protein [Acidobacteriota bacterium]
MFGRSLRRRLAVLAARVDGEGLLSSSAEASLARIERVIENHREQLDEGRRDVARAWRALDGIPQGVVLCDDEGREVFRNEMAHAFVDARHAEALVEQAVQEQLAAALAGAAGRRSLDILGPPRRMLVITAAPLDDGARPVGAVAVIDDVSERRRLEAVRRDFVANISHELKTPIGALGLLAETIASEEDPTVMRRLAERMTGEAFRVGRIIDDLLALSQIEAEEQPLRELLAVSALAAEAIDRIVSLAEAQHIVIDVSGVGPRHSVRGDRRQLVSALANLLENACKYSDPDSIVEVASVADGTWVEISVRDRGIGIPTRDLERVFERFYRVDRARSRETGGTGLGLAIVRHVAGNHSGEVRVDSQEGEGSTFTLRLPSGPGPVAVSTFDEPHHQAESA